MVRITRHLGELAAAHRLMSHGGECETLHGHNWDVTVWLEAAVDAETGIAIDFLDFDAFKRDLWRDLDHGVWLHERDPLIDVLEKAKVKMKLTRVPGEPTAENMAHLIAGHVMTAFPQALRIGVCLSEMHGCTAEISITSQPEMAAS